MTIIKPQVFRIILTVLLAWILLLVLAIFLDVPAPVSAATLPPVQPLPVQVIQPQPPSNLAQLDPYRDVPDRAGIECHQDEVDWFGSLYCQSPYGTKTFPFSYVRVSEEGYQYWRSGLSTYLFCDVGIDEYISPPNHWNCWNVKDQLNLAL